MSRSSVVAKRIVCVSFVRSPRSSNSSVWLLPPDLLARNLPLREQLRHKLLSRYRAHGLLGISGGADIFAGLGTAKRDPRPEHPGRNALREELVELGELVPVEVEGVRDALRAYLRFAAASRLEWAPHLGTEKRLFLTRP